MQKQTHREVSEMRKQTHLQDRRMDGVTFSYH